MLYCSSSPLFYHEGRYYALGLASIIKDYSESFGRIKIIAGCKPYVEGSPYIDVTDCIESAFLINGHIKGRFLRFFANKELSDMFTDEKLVTVRVPNTFGLYVAKVAKAAGIPVFVEVAGCAWDSMWHHSFLGKVLALEAYMRMKKTVKIADYAHYVTSKFLQDRYPSFCNSLSASDVVITPLSDDQKQQKINYLNKIKTACPVIFSSGAVNVKYKGQEYVIRALSVLKKEGLILQYRVAGGGNQDYLRGVAQRYGIADQVTFLGNLPKEKLFNELFHAHIYIQPSLTEGLPRALVEALNQGCPSLGSAAGGIPELLPDECLFKPKDVDAIADRIKWLLNSDLGKYAQLGFQKASEFSYNILRKRKVDYYNSIKNDCGIKNT